MRSVALLALAVLLILLGLRQEAGISPVAGVNEAEQGSSSVHSVHIFSTGWNMMSPSAGQRSIYKGFLVDATQYDYAAGGPGLDVMELPKAGGLSELHHFDLRYGYSEGNGLIEFFAGVEDGSVLIMGSSTTIQAGSTAPKIYREELEALFRELGAVSNPTRSKVQSFAFICMKSGNHFVPLAEAYSETKGVRLSYLIPKDRSELASFEPERVLDNRVPHLLQPTAAELVGFQTGSWSAFDQVGYPCSVAEVGEDAAASLTWDLDAGSTIPPGDAPIRFSARIASAWSNDPDMLGVRFTLLVDDLWRSERIIPREPGDAGTWLTWEAQLPPEKGAQRLTIKAEWLGKGSDSCEVMLAEPLLMTGRLDRLRAD